MNKKLVAQWPDGSRKVCILSGDTDIDTQLCELAGCESGCGLKAELWGKEIRIINYFRADTVGTIPLLSVEDTEEEPALYWSDI